MCKAGRCEPWAATANRNVCLQDLAQTLRAMASGLHSSSRSISSRGTTASTEPSSPDRGQQVKQRKPFAEDSKREGDAVGVPHSGEVQLATAELFDLEAGNLSVSRDISTSRRSQSLGAASRSLSVDSGRNRSDRKPSSSNPRERSRSNRAAKQKGAHLPPTHAVPLQP